MADVPNTRAKRGRPEDLRDILAQIPTRRRYRVMKFELPPRAFCEE